MSTFYVRYTLSNKCELFSDMFQTRTEACEYADYIRDINQNENSRVEVFKQENLLTNYSYEDNSEYVFQKSGRLNQTSYNSDNSDTNEPDFSGMTYREYGKGFLLTPPDNHPDYGTKYYHNGWWMPSQNGWFFKSKFFSTIINNGASSSTSLGSDTTTTKPFSGMTYSKYGKGYLLEAPPNHPDYGTKYYYEGWWMPTQNAWFFKKSSSLSSRGAKNSQEQNMFSGMTYSKYGKGYLLKASSNHPDYGTKYYNDGWWMPTQNAWFFKSKFKSFLKNNGASRASSH